MIVAFTVHNANPNTIANRLAAKLGRDATHAELCAEVARILAAAYADRARDGKLAHQKGKIR